MIISGMINHVVTRREEIVGWTDGRLGMMQGKGGNIKAVTPSRWREQPFSDILDDWYSRKRAISSLSGSKKACRKSLKCPGKLYLAYCVFFTLIFFKYIFRSPDEDPNRDRNVGAKLIVS